MSEASFEDSRPLRLPEKYFFQAVEVAKLAVSLRQNQKGLSESESLDQAWALIEGGLDRVAPKVTPRDAAYNRFMRTGVSADLVPYFHEAGLEREKPVSRFFYSGTKREKANLSPLELVGEDGEVLAKWTPVQAETFLEKSPLLEKMYDVHIAALRDRFAEVPEEQQTAWMKKMLGKTLADYRTEWREKIATDMLLSEGEQLFLFSVKFPSEFEIWKNPEKKELTPAGPKSGQKRQNQTSKRQKGKSRDAQGKWKPRAEKPNMAG